MAFSNHPIITGSRINNCRCHRKQLLSLRAQAASNVNCPRIHFTQRWLQPHFLASGGKAGAVSIVFHIFVYSFCFIIIIVSVVVVVVSRGEVKGIKWKGEALCQDKIFKRNCQQQLHNLFIMSSEHQKLGSRATISA